MTRNSNWRVGDRSLRGMKNRKDRRIDRILHQWLEWLPPLIHSNWRACDNSSNLSWARREAIYSSGYCLSGNSFFAQRYELFWMNTWITSSRFLTRWYVASHSVTSILAFLRVQHLAGVCSSWNVIMSTQYVMIHRSDLQGCTDSLL